MELSFLQKDACIAIGLMSGTSADGIDAAVVELRGCGTDTRVRQLGFITLPFSDEARQKILQVAGGAPLDSREICLLNFYLGGLSADACLEACRAAGIQPGDVDFVGSHGQTIWHEPVGADSLGRKVRATLQIGEPSLIAERLGCPVVSDFRVRDMAAGGLGAPLVPYTEYLLYREEHRPVALVLSRQNIKTLPALGTSRREEAAQVSKGGYVVMDSAKPEVVMVATGSEVATLVEGAELLAAEGISVRVVNVPSEGLFRDQPKSYQEGILPAGVVRYGLTSGLPVNLLGLVGEKGMIHGLDHFGWSAPYTVLDEKFGYNGATVAAEVKKLLGK